MRDIKLIQNHIENKLNVWINKYPERKKLYAGTTEKRIQDRLETHKHKENAIIHLLYTFKKLTVKEENQIINLGTESDIYNIIKDSETYAIQIVNDLCKNFQSYASLNINQIGGGLTHNYGDVHKIYLLLK